MEKIELLSQWKLKDNDDAYTVKNIRLGYTAGELDEDDDFDDGFKLSSHIYWNFTVLTETEDLQMILIDWNNYDNNKIFTSDEPLATGIAEICSKTSEDMFGDCITELAFESVILAILDEPEGYECMDAVLEDIGGEIIHDKVDANDEGFTPDIMLEPTNALFAVVEELDVSLLSLKDGEIFFKGDTFDIDTKYPSLYDTYAAFTEDVMNY